MGDSKTPRLADASANPLSPSASLQGHSKLADRAVGLSSVDEQNRLLTGIEARLANEMRGLGLTLAEFARRTKAIREEIPDSAQFCKLIAGCLPLFAFQLSDAILRAQLASWDKIIEKKSAENPLFKKILDSQKVFAQRAGQWQNDYGVDFKMAYNHYFSRSAKKA